MPAARVEYIAPWWVVWLHRVPHLSLSLQPVDSTFSPRDESYRESLLLLGLVAALGLALNLIFLAIYLTCTGCRRRRRGHGTQTKLHSTCCVTCTAMVAAVVCCAAVGVGFYGNSEANDGVYQLIYSLDDANHTFSGVDALVATTTQELQVELERHLARLGEILATRRDYIEELRLLQQAAGTITAQLSGLPEWGHVTTVLTEVATQTNHVEYYRWLSYLLLFILDVVICLIACLGLAKRSRCLLATMLCCALLTLLLSWTSLAADTVAAVGTSDFCVAPDRFILNITQGHVSTEVTRYYLYCSQSLSSPFQQVLTVFQRSLTAMQTRASQLLRLAVPLFPTAQKDVLGIQLLLNASETSLHQLTALLDCRGLHKDYLDALTGICYDGIQGLLYLSLFSLLAALAFSSMICAGPSAWKHFTARSRNPDYNDVDDDPFNPQARCITAYHYPRGVLHSSLSDLGSQTSLHPAAQTISNAPVSEYMNQAALFGGTPRYENVPLIGRGSPPPTYSPSMRATYLSVADEHLRRYGTEFPA